MNYQPKVTIIIPVYNGSNFLAEAIDAALSQTYKNCEIIVINDGSNDNGKSEKIALSYGDKIKYYLKKNGGVSSALNFAFKKMTGEWFSWLSHDDLYYPEKIEKQVEFINELIRKESNINLNKIVLHCATESIDKKGKVIKTPSYRGIMEKETKRAAIIGNVYNYRLSGCSFLLPAACIKDVGNFREDIRTVSDVEYWYRLLFNNYQFYCMTKDILVKNRSHGRQVGKTKVSLFEKELNELYISIADLLAKDDELNTVKDIEDYYLGLIKRNIKSAAEYTKNKYLSKMMSPFQIKCILPLKSIKWIIAGHSRDVVKYIYRKIYVK